MEVAVRRGERLAAVAVDDLLARLAAGDPVGQDAEQLAQGRFLGRGEAHDLVQRLADMPEPQRLGVAAHRTAVEGGLGADYERAITATFASPAAVLDQARHDGELESAETDRQDVAPLAMFQGMAVVIAAGLLRGLTPEQVIDAGVQTLLDGLRRGRSRGDCPRRPDLG